MYREVTMIEVREVLRLRGESLPNKRIAAQLGLDPKTVRRIPRQRRPLVSVSRRPSAMKRSARSCSRCIRPVVGRGATPGRAGESRRSWLSRAPPRRGRRPARLRCRSRAAPSDRAPTADESEGVVCRSLLVQRSSILVRRCHGVNPAAHYLNGEGLSPESERVRPNSRNQADIWPTAYADAGHDGCQSGGHYRKEAAANAQRTVF